jgi:hypothetical protein
MRVPVRTLMDCLLGGMSSVVGLALEMVLFGVFRAHLKQVLAPQRYRPIYSSSGRRNHRIRF